VSAKRPARPVWWRNTFFLFGALILVVAVVGFVRGEDAIRDPGQKRESNLALMYVVGGILMLGNGLLTHRQSLAAYEEEFGGNPPAA
jgi:hypothetical protein